MNGSDIETFSDREGNVLAVVVRRSFVPDGITFATTPDQDLQLGVMRRPAGYLVAAHEHLPQLREIRTTNEVLFVRKGLLKVTLFDSDRDIVAEVAVATSEANFRYARGHAVEFLEDSDVVEVKQGPYFQSNDKERFVPEA